MKIVFVIPEQLHILDLAGPLQLFQEARELGGDIHLTYFSTNEKTILPTVSGLSVEALSISVAKSVELPDLIFIPGMDLEFLNTISQDFFDWLRYSYKNGSKLCGICTGSFILAKAGLLENKKCTTHWKYLDRLKEEVPKIDVISNRFFIRDGNIFTTAGVASGIDLALHILEKEITPKMSRDVAREAVVYFRRSEKDPQFYSINQFRNHIDDTVHEAQDLLEEYSKPPTIEELSIKLHISPRNLTRVFKKSTGITINEYKRRLYREKAKTLINEGISKKEIAQLLGVSERQLSRILKK